MIQMVLNGMKQLCVNICFSRNLNCVWMELQRSVLDAINMQPYIWTEQIHLEIVQKLS
eukprot:CCRYP_002411-RA/>CCRYP_002411-RA protein AED:0.47 eAED:0.50 QI:181/0/0.5/1/0/0.5/2/0/57